MLSQKLMFFLENLLKSNCNGIVNILLFDGGYNLERERERDLRPNQDCTMKKVQISLAINQDSSSFS